MEAARASEAREWQRKQQSRAGLQTGRGVSGRKASLGVRDAGWRAGLLLARGRKGEGAAGKRGEGTAEGPRSSGAHTLVVFRGVVWLWGAGARRQGKSRAGGLRQQSGKEAPQCGGRQAPGRRGAICRLRCLRRVSCLGLWEETEYRLQSPRPAPGPTPNLSWLAPHGLLVSPLPPHTALSFLPRSRPPSLAPATSHSYVAVWGIMATIYARLSKYNSPQVSVRF